MITAQEIQIRRAVVEAATGRRLRRRKRAPRPVFPRGLQMRYQGALIDLSRECAAIVRAVLIPQLGPIMAEAMRYRENGRTDAADTIGRSINGIRLQLAERIPESRARGAAARQAADVNAFNRGEVGRQVKSVLGIELGSDPTVAPHIELFIRDNVRLIKSIPEALLDQVDGVVSRAARAGTRVEDIADLLEERFEVSESKAALIARDQTGKLNGELTQLRQENLGATTYVWSTSLDERVRPEHAAREGQICRWDDPPEGGAPGIDFNCRCGAGFNVEEVLGNLEDAET